MIYNLADGRTVDTALDLSFEERNFVQKMLIYEYMKTGLEDFKKRWRAPGNPVWQGPSTLTDPGPAARILLDLERKIRGGREE